MIKKIVNEGIDMKRTIGRKEHADITSFGLHDIIVKIDTGAYTSSIHIETAVVQNNQLLVVFTNEFPAGVVFNSWETKKVKSSNGISVERYTVQGEIVLGGIAYQSKFTLTNRSDMKYPALLGRKLLNKNFIVDTSKVNILSSTSNK